MLPLPLPVGDWEYLSQFLMTGVTLRDRSLRAVWNKLYNAQQASGAPYPHLKWMTSGDSMSQDMAQWFFPLVDRMVAGGATGGGAAGAYFAGPYRGVTTNATTGSVTGNTTDFDAWYAGANDQFATAATRTYGVGGSTFQCDLIKVYYAKGPSGAKDGGSFKIQIDGIDQGGFTNVSTVNAGGVTMGIATLSPTIGLHNVTIVCLAGPVRIIGIGFENTQIRGFVPINGSQGGIALNSPTATAWANYSAFIADVQPDIITYEAKEDSSYFASALTTFVAAIRTGSATCDVVFIGSSPVGPTAYSGKGDAEQVLQNQQLRGACGGNIYYWDGYTPLVDWPTVNALGWGTDPVHLGNQAQQYRAHQFMKDLGVDGFIGQPSPWDTASSMVTVDKEIDLGKTAADRMAKIVADATFDLDLSVQVRRYLQLKTLTGVTEFARFDLSGTGANTTFTKFMRFGAGTFAGMGGADTDTIFIGKNDNVAQPADVYLRRVRTVSNPVTTSGAVTMDLSVAAVGLYTLNGNVTSFAFSNPTGNEDIEVHFIQDGSGSKTLAGVNSSIKFAGATSPTLTTTASRRDIFRFRNIGGTYFEVSRSMNVG